MAEIKDMSETIDVQLFNGIIETGVRVLTILDANYPRSFDLTTLTWFDHIIVHTADFGGPRSLHPDLPQRSGELLVRRQLMFNSLENLENLNLIEALSDSSGISYRASEQAWPFLQLMTSSYVKSLQSRAAWAAANVCNLDLETLQEIVNRRAGQWNAEFANADPREKKS